MTCKTATATAAAFCHCSKTGFVVGKESISSGGIPPPPAIFLFQVPLCALKALLLSAIIGLVFAAPGSAQKIRGALTGSITEINSDEQVTKTNKTQDMTVTAHSGDAGFKPQSNTEGKYGTFTLAAVPGTRSAFWTYTLQDNWEDTDALNDGDMQTDEFEIELTDDKTTATVIITVIGVTDTITPRTAATDIEVVQLDGEERNRLRISWTGATNAPGGYRLRYREQGTTEWSPPGLVSSTDLSQDVTIDKSNQPYEVEVTTRNDKITKPRGSVVAGTETTKIFTTRGPIIESIVVEDNNGNRLERVLESGSGPPPPDPDIALKITLAEPLLGETDAARRMVMPKLVPASAGLEILKSSIELRPGTASNSVRSFARFTDDTELESLESFKVAIGDVESQTVSIVDNEAYAVRFDPASVTLSEGISQDITLRLDRPYQSTDNSPMRLDLELLFPDGMGSREVPNPDDPDNPNIEFPSDDDDLAIAGTGVTFSDDQGRVEIASGSDSVTIRVTAKADGKQEPDEQFKVKAEIGRVQPGIEVRGMSAELAITVRDVDPILAPLAGYLQDRVAPLLNSQPDLARLLQDPRSGIAPEGQLGLEVREGTLVGLEASLVRDGLWGEISATRSDEGASDHDYLLGALGLHGPVSETVLAGLMLQFDRADRRLGGDQGTIDGHGWLLGPYFVARYQTQPLYFDGRLLYGFTNNDIRFSGDDLGLRTGFFGTQRRLASLRLEGEVFLDYGGRDIRFIPHFDAGWVEDEADPFVDSRGIQVSGQTLRLGELALGSDIEIPVRIGQRDLTVTGGLQLTLTRTEKRIQRPAEKLTTSDTTGRVKLGMNYSLNDRVSLEIGATYQDSESAADTKSSFTFGIRSRF